MHMGSLDPGICTRCPPPPHALLSVCVYFLKAFTNGMEFVCVTNAPSCSTCLSNDSCSPSTWNGIRAHTSKRVQRVSSDGVFERESCSGVYGVRKPVVGADEAMRQNRTLSLSRIRRARAAGADGELSASDDVEGTWHIPRPPTCSYDRSHGCGA